MWTNSIVIMQQHAASRCQLDQLATVEMQSVLPTELGNVASVQDMQHAMDIVTLSDEHRHRHRYRTIR